MATQRVCILCKHWRFDSGTPGFSEYTPGDMWEMWCTQNYWRMEGWGVTQREYRETLLSATSCEGYAPGLPENT